VFIWQILFFDSNTTQVLLSSLSLDFSRMPRRAKTQADQANEAKAPTKRGTKRRRKLEAEESGGPPPVFSQVEQFDVDEAKSLLNALPYCHREIREIAHLLKVAPRGEIRVKYYHGDGLTFGHVFPDAGAGKLSRDSCNRLCHKSYFELRLVNASATLTRQILQASGISCPSLDMYCDSWEALQAEVKQQILASTGYDVTSDEVERLFRTVLHGGRYSNDMPDVEVPFLERLQDELAPAICELQKAPSFVQLSIQAQRTRNVKEAFVSYVIQRAEFQILEVARKFLLERGLQVGILKQDGLMVQKSPDVDKPELLDALAMEVHTRAGFIVQYVVKPLNFKPWPGPRAIGEVERGLALCGEYAPATARSSDSQSNSCASINAQEPRALI
jgi:hypothetical protein